MDERFSEEKIINSNSYGIAAAVQDAGGIPFLLGIAKDTPAALKEKISHGLTADILVLSGGVSMGDYDFTKAVFRDLGAEMNFWKLAIQARTAAGLRENPRQARLRVAGQSGLLNGDVRAIGTAGDAENERPSELRPAGGAGPVSGKVFQTALIGATFCAAFSRVKTAYSKYERRAIKGSGILTSMVKANCLIDVPVEVERLNPGDLVSVQLLSGEGWADHAEASQNSPHRLSCC